jgi:phospholipase/carboxylesterase
MLISTAGLRQDKTAKAPVLLVHGSADPIVHVAAKHASEGELKHLGVQVTTHVSAGVGHTVDPAGLRLGLDFVSKALSARKS